MENNYTVERLADYSYNNLSSESAIGVAAKEAIIRLEKNRL